MTIKKETYHSCIIYKDDTIRYFDKEGNELPKDFYVVAALINSLYTDYSSVKKIDEFTINDRYKSYVVFNENVITNDNFYLFNGSVLYAIWN